MTYILYGLVLLLLLPFSVCAQTGRLALIATQAEVTIWRARRTQTSPLNYQAMWNTLKSRASATVESRWVGNTTGGCPPSGWNDGPSRTRDRTVMNAGFVWLVEGDTTLRDKAITALLAQTSVAGTNFGNGTIWCPVGSRPADLHEVASWVKRLLYAYSFVHGAMTAPQRSTMDAWFLAAGTFFDEGVHAFANDRFSGRLNNNYTCDGVYCPNASQGRTHFGGPEVFAFGSPWSNTYATFASTAALIGLQVNDATLIAHGKRWFEEWVKYATYSGGQVFDQHRWNGSIVARGYFYPGTAIGSVISIADAYARAGDTSLYDYTTSTGLFGTQGGTKGLLNVIQNFAGKTNGTVIEYASTTSTTDPALIIDQVSNETRIDWINLTPAALYYNNAALDTAVNTTLPGAWSCGGYDCLMGEWGNYPDVRFMFLQTGANPYMGQVVAPAPFVDRCFAGRPEPNTIFIPVIVPSGLPLSGSSGCTARYGGVAKTVNTVAAGTLFSGQPGITLTMAENIASGTEIDISCGAGIADSDDNALTPVTNFACVNWFTQILNEEWATAATTGADGRPFSALSNPSTAEVDSWVVSCSSPPCTMQATYNLRVPLTASNLLVIGDDAGQSHCETVTFESDATCTGAWVTQVAAQDCNAREQFQYPLADVAAQCWRLTFSDDRGGASNGVQAFWANLTVAPDTPTAPPEQTVRRLRMMGGVLGLQGLRFR